VTALLDSTVVVYKCNYGSAQKEATVQARDVALATLLVMHGKDPSDFGFPGPEAHRVEPLKSVPLYPHYLGFYDDASRTTAHKKAKEWLEKQK
jgi:hypothetical protein